MKHTPGPWHFMNDTVLRKKAFAEAAPGITIANTGVNTEPICRVSGYLMPLEANARLIAAAPELLEALKAILEHGGSDAHDPPEEWCPIWCVEQAKKAIRKAEGAE